MKNHRGWMFLAGSIIAFASVSHAQRCSNTSVGLTPINDLGTGFYRGWQGGLYPGGSNAMPAEHLAAGEAFATQVRPLGPDGQPDPQGGKIVLLSIGMSNSWQEFRTFKSMTDDVQQINPALVVVNGAQPGRDVDFVLENGSEYWSNVTDSLSALGVTEKQVQAIWFKQAEAFPMYDGNDTTFHGYVDELKAKFLLVIQTMNIRFPNARLAYMASRSYGGYADFQLNPEPYAYYTGWSVKRLIEDQINGAENLSYSPPDPKAPWLSWGVYLWADGLRPRSDGLIWECSDFQLDGTHPSESGESKVAAALLSFFMTDPTTEPWFVETPTSVEPDGAVLAQTYSLSNYPNPFNPRTTFRFDLPVSGHVKLSVYDVTGQSVAVVLDQTMQAGSHDIAFDAQSLGSGVYLYRLQLPDRTLAGKMILAR